MEVNVTEQTPKEMQLRATEISNSRGLRNPNWIKLKNLFLSKKTSISNSSEHLFEFKGLITKREDSAHFFYKFS